jgi:hypothetical protein
LPIDELGAAHQTNDPIKDPKGLKALGGKGHVIDRVLVIQDLDHPIIEHLKKGMGDPVVGIHEIMLVKLQTVQEGAQGPIVVFPDVHEQSPGDPAAYFLVCR